MYYTVEHVYTLIAQSPGETLILDTVMDPDKYLENLFLSLQKKFVSLSAALFITFA